MKEKFVNTAAIHWSFAADELTSWRHEVELKEANKKKLTHPAYVCRHILSISICKFRSDVVAAHGHGHERRTPQK